MASIPSEFIYATVPTSWLYTYHRLLELLSEYGEEMLLECKARCNDKNIKLIDCYNMFNAAVAAYQIDKKKLAETILKYVSAMLDGYDNSKCQTSFKMTITSGEIKKNYLIVNKNNIIEDPNPEPEDDPTLKVIYYGVIDTSDATMDITSDSDLFISTYINENIISSLNSIDVNNVPATEILTLTKPKQTIVALVPEALSNFVKTDDGVGSKIPFSSNWWNCNGEKSVMINNIVYKIYGEFNTITGDEIIYIQ